jgi:uracil-DNA glycosylase family 4
MPKLLLTPWQAHQRRWENCQLCKLADTRRHVVLARGRIPCDVLFVGEAPGLSEDVLGQPFVGPAGQLLDQIIQTALSGREYRIAFTNIVACLPTGEEGLKAGEPERECIKACAPRLQQFVNLCDPRLIVTVGALAAKNLPIGCLLNPDGSRREFIDVMHPAAILRMDVTQKPLAIKRAVIILSDALSTLD